MFSEKRCLFFLSQVQSFKYGSANLFRSECVDAESKGDDGFKTVNLHAAFVRQFDGMLCLIFPQNTAFTKSLYPCSDCWGDNPEQLAEFPLGHGNGDCIGRQGMLPCPSIVMMLRFSFICILLYGLSNGTANAFLHIPQLVGQQFQVLTYLLGGYLRVDLSGLYVGMPQQAADGFNGYSVG